MACLARAGFGGWIRSMIVLAAAAGLAACATPGARPEPAAGASAGGGQYVVGEPYEVAGVWYYPQEQPAYDETGLAGVLSDERAGQTTANGEIYDPAALTGTHTTLPMPVMVEVTNLDTGATVAVRVNDRGPFGEPGRIIDLSRAAAEQLGFADQGTARVRVRYVGPAPLGDPGQYADGQAPEYLPDAGAPSAPEDAFAAAPESVGGGWTVQAGAFTVPANARRAVAMLSAVAPAEIVTVQVGGRTYYRVVLGPWPVAEEAVRARELAAGAGFPDAMIKRPY